MSGWTSWRHVRWAKVRAEPPTSSEVPCSRCGAGARWWSHNQRCTRPLCSEHAARQRGRYRLTPIEARVVTGERHDRARLAHR